MGMSASLISRLGSSTSETIHHCSVDVARGLVLLEDEVPSKAACYRFFSQLAFPADPNPMQIRGTTTYYATVPRKGSGHEHPSAASP
jgi:hypothetical protein